MNIVAVAAHQDDVELSCLGTLVKFKQRGDANITFVAMTNGNKGSQYDPKTPYAEVAATRSAEATAMATALGGHYIGLGYEDQYLRDTDEARNRLADIIRAAKADLVIAPPPVDYASDHMTASTIAFSAVQFASIKSIFTDHEPLEQIPWFYYMDAITGLESQPTHYIDITGVFEHKCELLRYHKSQMKNMERSGWDLVKYARIMGAFRGIQCGVEYAEAFRPCLAFPQLRPGYPFP